MSLWDTVFINPMINLLILLEQLLFSNFGLAIIVFTVLVRAATLPLMLRQLRSSKKMQDLAPKIQEMQKKIKDPKRRQEETMKLYREAGVNPIGCLGPMIIQFPIWIGLYQALTHTVGGTPERTVELAHRLYQLDIIQRAVPLPTGFFWLDLGRPDPYYILFVLVAATTWLQTKLSLAQSPVGQTATQQQTNTIMLWMMPFMFGYFTLTVPSGLAMYWVATNSIGIVMNWFVYGWRHRPNPWREIFKLPESGGPDGKGAPRRPRQPSPTPAPALVDGDGADTATSKRPADGGAAGKRTTDGQRRDKRKDGRGGGRESPPAARSGPFSGRGGDR